MVQQKRGFRWFLRAIVYSSLLVPAGEYAAAEEDKNWYADLNSWYSDFRLLEAEHVSVDFFKTIKKRDAYLVEDSDSFTSGNNFNLKLRILEVFRWDNKLHINSTSAQIRHVGWEFEVRMDYFTPIQPFYYHFSQHALERDRGNGAFPVEDKYGLRFIFIDQ